MSVGLMSVGLMSVGLMSVGLMSVEQNLSHRNFNQCLQEKNIN